MIDPLSIFRLGGRVVLITGTSSGLGRRFAEVLHAAGASVVLASRRVEEEIELAEQLRDAIPVACDVRLAADRERVVTTALDRHGRIDVLVNNAGIAHSVAAETETLEGFRDQLETNTIAAFALTQLVARGMLSRGGGSIVNVASVSSSTSLDRYPLAGYATSKGGLVALTRELAAQWAGRGVRVNAISPAWFPSATNGWLRDGDQVAWISARAPIGRPGRADELDGALLFLASNASTYVTGHDLVVDGGWSCR